MALPNRLKSSRMTDATIGDRIDNEVGNLEQALCDILGITIDVDVNEAGMQFTQAGLEQIKFTADAASDPAPATLQRNGVFLRYDNGTYVGDVAPIPPGFITAVYADTAPLGWIRIVSAYFNDRVIRIVTGARVDGGTWNLFGLSDQGHTHPDDHVHNMTHAHDLQNHRHNINSVEVQSGGGTTVGQFGNSEVPTVNLTSTLSASTSAKANGFTSNGFSQIVSDGTWRPLQLDMILLQKT